MGVGLRVGQGLNNGPLRCLPRTKVTELKSHRNILAKLKYSLKHIEEPAYKITPQVYYTVILFSSIIDLKPDLLKNQHICGD